MKVFRYFLMPVLPEILFPTASLDEYFMMEKYNNVVFDIVYFFSSIWSIFKTLIIFSFM